MKPQNTTDLLQSDLEKHENIRLLHEHLRKEVERYIDGELSALLDNRIVAEDLALTTLRQSIEHLKTDSTFRLNSEMFWRLIKHIAQNEICDAIKYLRAGKRDFEKDAYSFDDPTSQVAISKQELTPADQAVVKEQLRSGLAALLQEEDEQRKLINLLGIALQLSGRDIQAVLQSHPAGFKVLSLAQILRQIDRTKDRMRALGTDDQSPPQT